MGRRAIVCYVDKNPNLVQQLLALRLSCLHSDLKETDLVAFGPSEVLVGLPDDIVAIPQPAATDDPIWKGYRYINSIACMNGVGSERLEAYSHLLRTDVDTFVTPTWNSFHPEGVTTGSGAYVNDEDTIQRLRGLAADFGLEHRGKINIGSTWYGPTDIIRRACALSELLCKHLLHNSFRTDEGAWPGWYRGVCTLYAGEVALNHLAPDSEKSPLLDAWSTGEKPPTDVVHIHCWHTNTKFSKHWFMSGRYPLEDAEGLDTNQMADYCLALSFQSLIGLESWKQAQKEREKQ